MSATCGGSTGGRDHVSGILERLGAAQAAIRESGPDDVLAVTVSHLNRLVPAAHVTLVVPDGTDVRVRASTVPGRHDGSGSPLLAPLAPLGDVQAETARTVLRSGRATTVSSAGTGVVAVPVVVGADAEAVLILAATGSDAFGDIDLQLAELCAQAAGHRVMQLRTGSIEQLLQLDDGPAWLQPLTDPLTGRAAAGSGTSPRAEGREDRAASRGAAQPLAGPGWASWNPRTDEVEWSAQMFRQVGLDPSDPPMRPLGLLRLVHPDDRRAVVQAVRSALRGVPHTLQYRVRRLDGVVRTLHAWVDVRRSSPADSTPVLRAACLDVTEQVAAQRALAEAETALVHAMDQAPYGMVVIGTVGTSRGMVLRANLAFCDLVGRPSHEVQGPLAEALPVVGTGGSAEVLTVDVVENACAESQRLVRRLRTAAGNDLSVWLNVTEVGPRDARGPYLLVHVLDVTAQTNQQRALERLALHDPVTGLGNRSLLNVRLDRALSVDGRGPLALMMIDLDRFKTINDSLGHHVGDLLLQEVGTRLQQVAPGSALVARQGGDEFVLLWDAVPDTDAACRLAQDVVDTLSNPYELRTGHMVVSSVSVGVALAEPEADIDREDLARQADLAMYRSKELGGNGFAVCDDDMLATADRRLDSESRLRRAIEGDRLRVFLQPIVDLADRSVTGVEALLRVDDPDQGLLSPDQFIRVAEESGLIVDVDLWVLDRALRLLGTEGSLPGEDGTRLSVNVSCRTLERPGLCERIERLAGEHGADVHRLTIEITESSLLADSPAVQDALASLQTMGVRLAIDDFGTGYSALAYLQRFNLDVLKIDQSFVHRLATEPERARVTLGAIITLAHAHGLAVVAEGVETEGQARVLRELGCDLGQGWLYGAAVPPLMPVASPSRA